MSKLLKTSVLKGEILLKTGLHIGAGNDLIEIGGIDNPVVKDPKTHSPIIPGSSIKGKIRSLIEIKSGKKNICQCGDCPICKTFGNTSKDNKVGVTRAIFRDCFLSEKSKKELKEKNLLPTEAKKENTIDRFTGTTKAGGLRTSERVIAGLIFDFEVAIRVFENDNNSIFDLIKEGLQLLEKDALGGSGSRGYGKIEFQNLELDKQKFDL